MSITQGYARLLRRLGHQRWFAWVGRQVTPLDRWVRRRTKGKWSLSGDAATPALLLTTTGRKSGLPREQPLLYARDGADLVVVGSNWGQQGHPAWSGNLLADPAAVAEVDGEKVPVRAHLCVGEDRDRAWALLAAVWPAYDTYDRRAGRELRVFRLRPALGPAGPATGSAEWSHPDRAQTNIISGNDVPGRPADPVSGSASPAAGGSGGPAADPAGPASDSPASDSPASGPASPAA